MAVSIPLDQLAQRRLMIGTPMYEGLCHGAYAAALVALGLRLRELGVAFKLSFIINQSSAERGRAMIIDEFLRSDCTNLVFIDADVAVRPEDIVGLLALQSDDSPYDVIGGCYPRKHLDWETVARAVEAGRPASELGQMAGNPVVNFLPGTREVSLTEPMEIATVAGGFSMIRRATYERLIAHFPDLAFVPDEHERAGQGLGDMLYAFHAASIDPATRHLRSEDFTFCDRVRAAGMSVWLCPWMHADHIGNFRFTGTLIDALKLRHPSNTPS